MYTYYITAPTRMRTLNKVTTKPRCKHFFLILRSSVELAHALSSYHETHT